MARIVCHRSKRAKMSDSTASSSAAERWLKLMGAARAVVNECAMARPPATRSGANRLTGSASEIAIPVLAAGVREARTAGFGNAKC
jgi:hypothetical protein